MFVLKIARTIYTQQRHISATYTQAVTYQHSRILLFLSKFETNQMTLADYIQNYFFIIIVRVCFSIMQTTLPAYTLNYTTHVCT